MHLLDKQISVLKYLVFNVQLQNIGKVLEAALCCYL